MITNFHFVRTRLLPACVLGMIAAVSIAYNAGSQSTGVAESLGGTPTGADTSPLAGDNFINDGFDFVPLTPCRIFDTRITGAKIAANATKSINVWGADDVFVAQGGRSCGVSRAAVAVHIDLIAVDASAIGYLTVWPFLEPRPEASVLNYNVGVPIANGLTVKSCHFECAKQLNIFTNEATHVIVDIMGYYVPKIAIKVGSNGAPATGSQTGVPVRLGVGEYLVDFYRDVTDCSVVASLGESAFLSAGPGFIEVFNDTLADRVRVRTYNSAGALADKAFRLVGTC